MSGHSIDVNMVRDASPEELLQREGELQDPQRTQERLRSMLPVSARFEKTAEGLEGDLLTGPIHGQSREKRLRDFTLSSTGSKDSTISTASQETGNADDDDDVYYALDEFEKDDESGMGKEQTRFDDDYWKRK